MARRNYSMVKPTTNALYYLVETEPGQWLQKGLSGEAYQEILRYVESWSYEQRMEAYDFCYYHNLASIGPVSPTVNIPPRPEFFPSHWRIL